MKFRDDQFDDDGELLLGMKEINQRRKELNMTEGEKRRLINSSTKLSEMW